MKTKVFRLVFLFLFSFNTLVFLIASLLGDSWWVSASMISTDRVGLLRNCNTIFFQKAPELVCSFRDNALQLDKNAPYKGNEKFTRFTQKFKSKKNLNCKRFDKGNM